MVPLDQKHTLGGDNPLGFGGWDMGTWGLVRFRFFTGHCLDIVPDVVPHVTQLSPSGKCTRGYLYMYIKTNIYIYTVYKTTSKKSSVTKG